MLGKWNDEELEAALSAYREMQELDRGGREYSKIAIFRRLATRFGRSAKAFEYRMQNISAVLAELNLPRLRGMRPATHVGAVVKSRIMKLVSKPNRTPADQTSYRAKLPAMRSWLIGVARQRRYVTYGDMMREFTITRFPLRHALAALGHESRENGEPLITALVVNKASGHCSAGIQNEFGVVDDAKERTRLYEFWQRKVSRPSKPVPGATIQDRAERFSQVEVRPDQARFRRDVFIACSGMCVISKCDEDAALDAAHRKGRDWRLGHNSWSDGLLLRKDLHALFDAGQLRIDDDGRVSLVSSRSSHYRQFNGIKILEPSLPR